jgi:hypothetical protein
VTSTVHHRGTEKHTLRVSVVKFVAIGNES